MTFLIDFDGTIIQNDSVDALLEQYATSEWKMIEERWQNNEISSKQCMEEQIKLLKASKVQLKLLINQLKIDPSFKRFVDYIRHYSDIVIISDGLDYVIRHTLFNESIYAVEIYANILHFHENDRLSLSFPYFNSNCDTQSGICKCQIAKQRANPLYLVGDGKSNVCLAKNVDYVFAKGILRQYCLDHHIPNSPVDSFDDVLAILKKISSFLIAINE